MNISEHIEKLKSSIHNSKMSYTPAYDDNGKDLIGMRGVNRDVFIDDIGWMICGKPYYSSRVRILTVDEMAEIPYDIIIIHVTAQAIIAGSIVQVHIGDMKISSNDATSNTVVLE